LVSIPSIFAAPVFRMSGSLQGGEPAEPGRGASDEGGLGLGLGGSTEPEGQGGESEPGPSEGGLGLGLGLGLGGEPEVPQLSKKATKRLRKEEARAQLKALKKVKKRSIAPDDSGKSQTNAGEPISEAERAERVASREARKLEGRREFLQSCEGHPQVVIDCEFFGAMSDKEIKSLTQQIMYCYGYNKRAAQRCLLHLSR
jgi:hypothetical protein